MDGTTQVPEGGTQDGSSALAFIESPAFTEIIVPKAEGESKPEVEGQTPPEKEAAPAKEVAAEPVVEPLSEPKPEDVPAEPEVKPLATEFVVADPEGELDEHDAAEKLRFSFKANGEDKKDVPLDQVIRMAQMGYYNEDREKQVLAAKQYVPQLMEQNKTLQDEIAEYRGLFDKVMTDDQYVARARAEYQRLNSPEVRAQRAESQLQELQSGRSTQNADQARMAFANEVAVPALLSLQQKYPSVSLEALVGRTSMLTTPLQVRGQVPAERLPEVRRIVEQDVAAWAEDQHQKTTKAQQASAAAVTKQQEKTTLAKRQVARAVQPPAGSTGAPIREQTKPRTFKSADDWLNSPDGLMAAVLQSSGGDNQ